MLVTEQMNIYWERVVLHIDLRDKGGIETAAWFQRLTILYVLILAFRVRGGWLYWSCQSWNLFGIGCCIKLRVLYILATALANI
jgi:hypothetical protein